MEKKEKVIVDSVREIGKRNDWDDFNYLSDSELLKMYPIDHYSAYQEDILLSKYSDEDYERLIEIIDELESIHEDILYSKESLKASDTHYTAVTELRSDIVALEVKASKLLAESEEIKSKYDRRNR